MLFISLIVLLLLYIYGISKFKSYTKTLTTNISRATFKHSVLVIIIYGLFAVGVVFIFGSFLTNQVIKYYLINYSHIKFTSNIVYDSVKESLAMFPKILAQHHNHLPANQISFYIRNDALLMLYHKYNHLRFISNLLVGAVGLIVGIIVIEKLLTKLKIKLNSQKRFERIVKKILLCCASITILATLAIVTSLLWETIGFFQQVPLFNFLFGTQWAPQNIGVDPKYNFGIIPLLTGTFLIAIIALIVALIIGLPSAIYMSEFMPKGVKAIVKPVLEILSGIPTIVYGFFAALVLAPYLVKVLNKFHLTATNESAIVAGLVIGIMIVPFISSTTDDILNSIPKSTREGGYALGSMSYEVVLKILMPIAMPGILSSTLLAFSRAIGETMIVVMASGLVAKLTFNPLEPVTTITTQIVTIAQGDQDFSGIKTLSLFALGLTLFCVTLLLNLFSFWVIKMCHKKY